MKYKTVLNKHLPNNCCIHIPDNWSTYNDNIEIGERAKFLTTTAKQPHSFEYIHNEIGYNFRMPNLNAALGCAQFKYLESYIDKKRELASKNEKFLRSTR